MAALRPYNDPDYRRARAWLKANPQPCWRGCGRTATTLDHVPAIMEHTHQRGARCCELRPACLRCNTSDGAAKGNAKRNPSSGWLSDVIVRPEPIQGGLTTDPHVVVEHSHWQGRNVSLICGPPGSGKSTLARKLHASVLEVEQFDGPGITPREALRRYGLAAYRIGKQPLANVGVVRGGASDSERQRHETMCKPARTIVLLTPPDVCLARITQRQGDAPWAAGAVAKWWASWGDAPSEPTSGWV